MSELRLATAPPATAAPVTRDGGDGAHEAEQRRGWDAAAPELRSWWPGGRVVAAVWGLQEAVLDGALHRAGLHEVRSTRVHLRGRWGSPPAYTAFHRSSPMHRLTLDSAPEQRGAAWREVTAAATRRWGTGPLRLPGEVVVVGGRRRT